MRSNNFKTAVLLALLWGVIVGIGWLFAASRGSWMPLVVAIVIAGATNLYAYWNSDRLALAAMRAYPVSPQQAPQLYAIVSELSQRAGEPMPRLYIAPSRTPNAFATGRNPEHAAVCCTEGILNILNERELRAVLGHELMHVYNRDILLSSMAAAMASVITSLAHFLFFFGGRSRYDGEGGGANPIAMLAMMFLAPLAASLMQLAVSRSREFEADHDGAELTQDPLALASALRRLEHGNTMAPLEPTPTQQNVAAMMIANPLRGNGIQNLFSTHPPMRERIERLEKLAGY